MVQLNVDMKRENEIVPQYSFLTPGHNLLHTLIWGWTLLVHQANKQQNKNKKHTFHFQLEWIGILLLKNKKAFNRSTFCVWYLGWVDKVEGLVKAEVDESKQRCVEFCKCGHNSVVHICRVLRRAGTGVLTSHHKTIYRKTSASKILQNIWHC